MKTTVNHKKDNRVNRNERWETHVTMFGCVSCRKTEISRSVVLGMPSSSTSSRIRWLARIITNKTKWKTKNSCQRQASSIRLPLPSSTTAVVPERLVVMYLECHNLVSLLVLGLVHDTVSSFTHMSIFFDFLVAIHVVTTCFASSVTQ